MEGNKLFPGTGKHEDFKGSEESIPDLSIVIVNYNTKELLLECIESILKSNFFGSLELIVVDNASSDGSAGVVEEKFRGLLTLLRLNENVGFSAANNRGIDITSGRYVLLLNPDTVVHEGTLNEMVRFMDENPDAGVAGCRIDLPDGSLDAACRRSIPVPSSSLYQALGLHKLFPNSRRFAEYNLSWLDVEGTYPVGAVCGAFFMLRRSAMNEVGLLDERFFMYGEDLDYCLRTSRAGWRVFYHGQARITHVKRGSSSKVPGGMLYTFHEAMVLFYKKHYAADHNFVYNTVVLTGIGLRYILAWTGNFFKRRKTNRV